MRLAAARDAASRRSAAADPVWYPQTTNADTAAEQENQGPSGPTTIAGFVTAKEVIARIRNVQIVS